MSSIVSSCLDQDHLNGAGYKFNHDNIVDSEYEITSLDNLGIIDSTSFIEGLTTFYQNYKTMEITKFNPREGQIKLKDAKSTRKRMIRKYKNKSLATSKMTKGVSIKN